MPHANWLRNRLPRSRINMEIPYTRWYGTKSDFTTLLKFGTEGHALIYRSHKVADKLRLPRSLQGFLVGRDSDSTLYRIYVPRKQSIVVCRTREFTFL